MTGLLGEILPEIIASCLLAFGILAMGVSIVCATTGCVMAVCERRRKKK
ncbi:MAG TPA: hypothetical protein VL598_16605 [Trinickia sp.]|jgi:hypothetical protein|nr:hypothetical protein [Trinickia sp.]HTI19271.1 hypothetical protein [Trinickia sp.]